jgi:site-specific recombinase XerD
MNLQTAKEHFLLSLAALGRSQRTIDTYDQRLSMLTKFLSEKGVHQLGDVRPVDLDRWAVHMRGETPYQNHNYRPTRTGKKLSNETINGRLRDCRIFFAWCVKRDYLNKSPAAHLRISQPRHAPVKAMSKDDLHRMIDATKAPRNEAIIRFLADTGCRSGELRSVRMCDCCPDHRRADVIGKTGRRTVYFTAVTATAIMKWIRQRPAGSIYLFVCIAGPNAGEQITHAALYQTLRRIGKRAGVKRFNPHAIRHLVGQVWTDETNLELARRKLGHKQISSTARYANQDDERLISQTEQIAIACL